MSVTVQPRRCFVEREAGAGVVPDEQAVRQRGIASLLDKIINIALHIILGGKLIAILGTYLSNPDIYNINSTHDFLQLSWNDNRNAAEIVDDITKDRRNKNLPREYNGIFD